VKSRNAFTLVELLVVIAIIGILVALLLPAVQAAREAARRTNCVNNLKQMGLALHNFHDTAQRFPPGAAADQPPFGSKVGGQAWGSTWMIYILPFIEQVGLYQKFTFPGASGWGNTANAVAISKVIIPVYSCPSSPLSKTCASNPPGATGPVMATTYVGISGAIEGLIPTFTETRIGNGNGGKAGAGGILYPNSQTRIADITDGTTNTFFLSEQGDFLKTLNGSSVQWRSNYQHGLMIGSNQITSPPSYGGDNRTFGQTTIRYPINKKEGWPDAGDCAGMGVCQNLGNNIPLNSAHPGGVTIGMADGSVRFLKEELPMDALAQLVTRNDGKTISVDY